MGLELLPPTTPSSATIMWTSTSGAMQPLAECAPREKANVASAIVGASRPGQVHDNAAASGVELDAGTQEEIEAILGGK